MDKSSVLRAQRLGMSAAEIRQLRHRLDWTQVRLALVLVVHRLTIGRWERDQQRPGERARQRPALLATTSVGAAVQARAARDGRPAPSPPAWFQNSVSRRGPDGHRDGSCWPINRVVDWSRSAGRGPLKTQDEFLFAAQLDGCMRWGLCDTGAAVAPAEADHAS